MAAYKHAREFGHERPLTVAFGLLMTEYQREAVLTINFDQQVPHASIFANLENSIFGEKPAAGTCLQPAA